MSDVFTALSIYTILCIFYWTIYAFSREKVQNIKWRIIFLLNLFYLVLLLIFGPKFLIENFKTSSVLLTAGIIAAIFSVLHHFSIIIHGKKKFKLAINEIHGPISHIVVFLILPFMAIIVWKDLFSLMKNNLDTSVLVLFCTLTITISFFGIIDGFGKIKLWK